MSAEDLLLAARDALEEAPLDEGRWSDVLRVMAQIGGGWGAQLIGVSSEDGVLFDHAWGVPPETIREFEKRGGADPRINPRARILAAPPLQVRADYDLATPDELGRNAFYNEFLVKHGAPFFAGVRLPGDGDSQVVLAVLRDQSAAHFQGGEEEKLLQTLLPQLCKTVRLQQRLERQQILRTAEAFEAARMPALMCDRTGSVIALTALAEDRLSQGSVLNYRQGRIVAANVREQERLAAALRRATSNAASAAATRSCTLALCGPSGERDVIDIAPFPRQPFGVGLDGVCIVLLSARIGADILDLLMSTFLLSRAEAAIALYLIQGAEIADIAVSRGVSIATIRNQRKSVFAKLGVNSRSELTRALAPIVWRRQ